MEGSRSQPQSGFCAVWGFMRTPQKPRLFSMDKKVLKFEVNHITVEGFSSPVIS